MMKFHSSNQAGKKTYRRGVGLILLNNNFEVFIARRIDPILEAWQMPQGGIEPGETAIKSLFRETLEEIGTNHIKVIAESAGWYRYDLPIALQSKLWSGKYLGQEQKWFLAQYIGEDSALNIKTKKPEFDDWRWIEFSKVGDLIVDFKKQLYKNLQDEFGPIIQKLKNANRSI